MDSAPLPATGSYVRWTPRTTTGPTCGRLLDLTGIRRPSVVVEPNPSCQPTGFVCFRAEVFELTIIGCSLDRSYSRKQDRRDAYLMQDIKQRLYWIDDVLGGRTGLHAPLAHEFCYLQPPMIC